MYGQVIGIATLQAAEGQSLNFAVPGERISRLRAGELQTFATLASEAVKSKRAAAQTLYSQGLAQLSRDDYVRAASSFERAVEIDPNYVEAWYQLGYAFGMTGRHQDALKASRQAAKLRPDWAETYLNIGASSFALSQFKEAVDAYRQATKLDPANADALYALGLSLGRAGRADEEILAYQRALAIKSDFVLAWEQIGIAYFKQKRYSDALGAFEQYKTYKPDARADNYLGECYLELGRTAEAINALNSAVAFNPDFDKARYNLGRAYLKSGDRDSASVQYEMLRNGRSEWADKLLILMNQ
jgi:tetratricopeptide (TPR) repeat protein